MRIRPRLAWVTGGQQQPTLRGEKERRVIPLPVVLRVSQNQCVRVILILRLTDTSLPVVHSQMRVS